MNSESVPSIGRRVTEYLQGAAVVFLLLLKALEVKMGKGDTQNQKEKASIMILKTVEASKEVSVL